MTTKEREGATPKSPSRFQLPDIPEKHPDDMTTAKHLALNGNMYHLSQHLGVPETTIVSGDRYICRAPGSAMRYPDLLVAFNADPALYELNNGYIISEQGKTPDFVLEIASRRTGSVDTGVKRLYYEELEIPEYWRFDETGEFHGARLGGDVLVNGRYAPAAIEELQGGIARGYSERLRLYLHWDDGKLVFADPATNMPIATLETEREARLLAEARVRQLEAQLRRQGQAQHAASGCNSG